MAGASEVPARSLHSHIQKLMAVEAGDTVTGMELEFKVSKSSSYFTCSSSLFGGGKDIFNSPEMKKENK